MGELIKKWTTNYFPNILIGATLFYVFLPLTTGKPFLFYSQAEKNVVAAFILIMTACIVVSSFILKGNRIRLTMPDYAVIGYMIYMIFGIRYFSEASHEYYTQLIVLASLYICCQSINPIRGVWILLALPICLVIQVIHDTISFTQPWQNLSDITGIFDNTGIWGGFVAITFIGVVGWHLFLREQKYRIYIHLSLALFGSGLLILLYSTASRAAWLGCIGGILFLCKDCLLYLKLKRPNNIIMKYALLAGAIFACSVFLLKGLYNLKKDSADGRLLIWEVSCKMIKANPIFGNGHDGFLKHYMYAQADYFKENRTSRYRQLAGDTSVPFNEYIKLTMELGVAGIFFLIVFFYIAFCPKEYKKPDSQSEAVDKYLQSIILTIAIFSFFSYPSNYIQFRFLLIYCFALLVANRRKIQQANKVDRLPSLLRNKIYSSLCVAFPAVLVFAISTSLYQDFDRTQQWNQALQLYKTEKDEAIEIFKQLYPQMKHNAWFVTTYGKALQRNGQFEEAVPILENAMTLHASAATLLELGQCYEQIGHYEKATEAWTETSYMVPSRFQPICNIARLLFEQQQYEKARLYAEQIMHKEVKTRTPEVECLIKEMRNIYLFHPPEK